MPASNPPPLEYPGLSDFIDDIVEDLRRHPIGTDHTSVGTVTRHISQVSALLARVASEAHAHSDHAHRHPEPSIWRPTHILSMTSVSLAEALSGYTKILAPLTIACEPTPYGTVDDAMDRFDFREAADQYLPLIRRALSEARDHVKPDEPAPQSPSAPSSPTREPAIDDVPGHPDPSPADSSSDLGPQPSARQVPSKLNAAQHRALQTIAEHEITVYLSKYKLALSGQPGPHRFTMRTVEALEARDLVKRSFATTLVVGQRLHLTPAGKQALDGLGPAPLPAPTSAPAPVRPVRPPAARTR
ncbi:hypothetical protein [Streptomyces antarcticus]|uniref:hypothetical protein n=1 Tax=Streptomyces antarcticus TaxID=2996458 RepID=UPI002271F2E8|nr:MULTISPECIES: hypothetical protein [unclassified Streptomyces]MCY0942326.1 hypothetical protein [Streptomyces sp. H34-AA3]MCZ4080677.1 hypothetical protein [Streptomyces sp. H34-S5]